ncbi:MAG: UDP-2,3-diacylglucosamine diphosphatase LpxI [Candidatus Tectomicrobia bacterium]|uniref:UDP-2,3-diacylglucosamine diphosphatase LpxI n=1 Tax=Tectimicrobiota bacterium TaxID=2528274 RepID=A0A932G0M5_UNCTE|nr:UDP-2,3-diacylglucosamine diphosphatase LpxI [Candidatus Tectomicrobia bacterium]
MSEGKIGLIAGQGKLPVVLAQAASDRGFEVIAVALSSQMVEELRPFVRKVYSLGIGQTNKIIKTLCNEGVKEVTILGSVDRSVLLKPWKFDWRAIRSLRRIPHYGDDNLFQVIKEELAKDGLQLVDQTHFLRGFLIKKGVLTRRSPTSQEWQDIEYGFQLAKEIGRLDIGQTVVVKGKTVLAVEAIEGTDEAIRRGCRLAQAGAIVVKVSRPQQDFRLDVPTVGNQTIQVMREGKAIALALEAERTLVVDLQEVVSLADAALISVVAL